MCHYYYEDSFVLKDRKNYKHILRWWINEVLEMLFKIFKQVCIHAQVRIYPSPVLKKNHRFFFTSTYE